MVQVKFSPEYSQHGALSLLLAWCCTLTIIIWLYLACAAYNISCYIILFMHIKFNLRSYLLSPLQTLLFHTMFLRLAQYYFHFHMSPHRCAHQIHHKTIDNTMLCLSWFFFFVQTPSFCHLFWSTTPPKWPHMGPTWDQQGGERIFPCVGITPPRHHHS